MATARTGDLKHLPSVDEVLKTPAAASAVDRFGRSSVVNSIREALAAIRAGHARASHRPEDIVANAVHRLEAKSAPSLRPVFNLTGTVLHTNLGRAILAEEAVQAALIAMRNAVTLEFDLESGRRGERDDHLRELLCELTGAEDAVVVNNNAAAVLLVLNTLAKGREVIVSRGELIEIGGAFRLPEIMARAGAKLVEVGTTNRTHLADYRGAIGPKSAAILKVHTSNYRIEGFTAEVAARDLSALSHALTVPLVHDLGSGTLVDLARFGLAHEPTVAEALADGIDLVTFSGDKLLGGPQAGFIVGNKDRISAISRNPMKRALRVDKIRLAALEATLKLYRNPDRIAQSLPAIRLLARTREEVQGIARRIAPALSARVGPGYAVETIECKSQTGSGALPLETVASAGIAISPLRVRGKGRVLSALAAALRHLPIPVIGRTSNDAFILDLRCLEDEHTFVENLVHLDLEQMHEPA